MVKLNRTSEYGLIALRHMFRKQKNQDSTVTSAREVADHYQLPFEITAKTLQRLKDTGLIQSAQGARGGYTLNELYENYSFGDFIEAMEGPVAIVSCAAVPVENAGTCEYINRCGMSDVMSELNVRMKQFLAGITLTEILKGEAPKGEVSKNLVKDLIKDGDQAGAARSSSIEEGLYEVPYLS
jgi:Rrf2 family protein